MKCILEQAAKEVFKERSYEIISYYKIRFSQSHCSVTFPSIMLKDLEVIKKYLIREGKKMENYGYKFLK